MAFKIQDDFNTEIKIVIDTYVVELYRKYWYKHNPRKKCEIKSPILESLNYWMTLNNFIMNTKKQKWGSFSQWLVEYYGFKGLNLTRCGVQLLYYFKDNIRRDPDNYTPKHIHDGFVKGGLFADDSFKEIEYLIITRDMPDKMNPRTEFIIRYDKNQKIEEKDDPKNGDTKKVKRKSKSKNKK